jgi:sigma-E factor negative regulatory protein RseB
MKYFHAAKNEVEQERLLSLNSPLREIIRDANRISCHFISTQQVIVDQRPVESSLLFDMPKNIAEQGLAYGFSVVGEEDVAMRPAIVIALQPKDNYRYVRKIWVEKNYFLPLKVVIYDFSGLPLEQVMFTELELIDSLPFVSFNRSEREIALSNNNSLSSGPFAQPEARLSLPNFVVTHIPYGFQQIFFARSPVHNSSQLVDHMVLSDGFSAVSVYMESKSAAMQSGLQSIGAVNSFSRALGDFELTVMGEVPASTVEYIADGIKLREVTQ